MFYLHTLEVSEPKKQGPDCQRKEQVLFLLKAKKSVLDHPSSMISHLVPRQGNHPRTQTFSPAIQARLPALDRSARLHPILTKDNGTSS